MTVTYTENILHVDWEALKVTLKEDKYDNGRTPLQYRLSAENSYANAFAYDGNQIVGNARVLSDGVCNAYIIDVWTYTPYRHQGIASHMIRLLMEKLQGQHIYLFTDDQVDFYRSLGFEKQDHGMGTVVGDWLQNKTLLLDK